eukprot:1701943-Heterocapsa_arctica.AAC.1
MMCRGAAVTNVAAGVVMLLQVHCFLTELPISTEFCPYPAEATIAQRRTGKCRTVRVMAGAKIFAILVS